MGQKYSLEDVNQAIGTSDCPFNFGDVTYEEFSAQYQPSESCFCEKIQALPMAVWSLALAVYDIAIEVMTGVVFVLSLVCFPAVSRCYVLLPL